MRRLGLSLFVVMVSVMLAPFWASASSDVLKNWSDGPLEWSDFRNKAKLGGVPSYMKAYLTTDPTEMKGGNSKSLYRLEARAVMNCDASFAESSQCTKQRLRYHQLQFDVLEYYRRRLQTDLNSGVSGIEADNRVKYYQSLYSDRIDKIAETTNSGRKDEKLQEEEYLVRKQLDEMGLPPVPVIAASNFCYGFYAGIGGVFPTGSIKDDFSGCATFMLGLTGGYRRFKAKADIAFGQPNFENDNIFNVTSDIVGKPGQGNTNSFATYLGIGTSVGYTVFANKRIAITPNFGGYWSSYGWKVANYKYETRLNETTNQAELVQLVSGTEKKSLNNFNWIASIDFDIKIHKHVSDTPFFLSGQREEFMSSIRITPFVARAVYNKAVPAVSGYQVGVTVSYLGLARALKLQ